MIAIIVTVYVISFLTLIVKLIKGFFTIRKELKKPEYSVIITVYENLKKNKSFDIVKQTMSNPLVILTSILGVFSVSPFILLIEFYYFLKNKRKVDSENNVTDDIFDEVAKDVRSSSREERGYLAD